MNEAAVGILVTMFFEMNEKPIVFCATQRSGSTMVFNDYLSAIGKSPRESELLSVLCKSPDASPVRVHAAVREVAAAEGRFADKIMYHNMANIVRKLLPNSGDDHEHLFFSLFAEATWIYVERTDIFEQCVSMHMAESTNLWNIWDKHDYDSDYNRIVPYDIVKLRNYFVYFSDEREKWRSFFSRFNISPLEIVYEEAAGRHPEYMRQLLAKIGVTAEAQFERRIARIGTPLNLLYANMMRNQLMFDVVNGNEELWKSYESPSRML